MQIRVQKKQFLRVHHRHRAELVALEQLAIFADSLLHKECRTARHLDFDQNGHDEQNGPQEKETDEGDNAVEEEFKVHIDGMH